MRRSDARAGPRRDGTTTDGDGPATDPTCRVEADAGSALVRVTGVLDTAGARAVREALLLLLADRPGPVVADLSGLRVGDPAAVAVFPQVRRDVVDWPAAELLLCDPAGQVPGVPSWPTLGAALAALPGAPTAAVLSADLDPAVGSARWARQLVTDGCVHWGVPTLTEPCRIAVTELVNNVVAHARTPMTVRLAPRHRELHLAVRDRSPRLPSYAGVSPAHVMGGRGMLLVDTVARRWGSTPVPDGKVVWCVLHTEDEPF
ncbi:Histidine kinase-like ATPase domain-containing protein [Micromonospora nigra]|uniref:Histidine kinase-like ATPase domain-containing protein n=1 Tax=Micromonospora nigra TaxID=145857 RepID=A0A1C6RPD1_9ACTN|nr:ATP-binding protein [Micromonospora nigra]SCL19058.1 Histidine kinase-like ATPase domain-containing protein [Micromonospora nigra]